MSHRERIHFQTSNAYLHVRRWMKSHDTLTDLPVFEQQQEQDPTNLYISNLPLSVDEKELENMLQPFGQVVSTRILRDYSGNSRGVGFARLVSNDRHGHWHQGWLFFLINLMLKSNGNHQISSLLLQVLSIVKFLANHNVFLTANHVCFPWTLKVLFFFFRNNFQTCRLTVETCGYSLFASGLTTGHCVGAVLLSRLWFQRWVTAVL